MSKLSVNIRLFFSRLALTNCLNQNIINNSRIVILLSDWKNSANYLLFGSSEAGLRKINEHASASRHDKIQQKGKVCNNRSYATTDNANF